uniref:Odorant receptor n=1 Tax=Aulacocentrum confusum TaxID=2767324 RepID=A0A7G8Z929_9HYME|nr:olfactory receptor 10 [Aulacocentrum confusum]
MELNLPQYLAISDKYYFEIMVVLTPEFIFKLSKYTVAPVCSWPPVKNSSRSEILLFNLRWWIGWIISIIAVPSALAAAIESRNDKIQFAKLICIAATYSQSPMKMLIFKLFFNRMQYLFENMELYIQHASIREKKIFEQYANHYGSVHIGYYVISYFTITAVILAPVALPQSLPAESKYPFSVENHPVWEMTYCLQVIQALLSGSCIAMDCQIALLLWFIIVQFKILAVEIQSVENSHEFFQWIEKHQKILLQTDEIVEPCSYLQLMTVIFTVIPIIFGGVILFSNSSFPIKVQICGVVFTFIAQLFISAWPSESLMRASADVCWNIYESEYFKRTLDRRIAFIIQRSQKSIIIGIPGILPSMSMTYYSQVLCENTIIKLSKLIRWINIFQFLSKTASFFTTVRIVISKMDG